ncbi:DUF5666 domain-containing protein [Terriglobus aquaticus]|uniref:DUF5666 domain-containing protein n=1 Tax=Terriglobus aquaticus TaxID=940139 RepID=UPI0021DFA416|nr:DUF5666 domain-containing protein [Terriglobus aquaticus]
MTRCVVAAAVVPAASSVLLAQAAATGAQPGASAVQTSVGTVQSVSAGTLSLNSDKGGSVSYTLPANVRVLQLAPGSTDLKTAQPASVTDIAEGDRALVSGRAGDNGTATALRVVLMKSGAIAQNNASRQQDWQRRGSGGIVEAVDPAAHTLTVTSGTHKETITTTPSTVFRRYAPGSVKFEEASLSKIDDIHPGDQVRVRGDKSSDGSTIAADEIVSGAFRNVAGLITRVDSGANTVTLNDLATKKPVTIAITGESDLRSLPAEMAARFAARARGGAAGQGGTDAAAGSAGARQGAGGVSAAANSGEGAPGGAARGAGGSGGPAGVAGRPAGGRSGDLSQVITRLPKATLADLKTGEAVMVVASGASGPAGNLTAITLLSGVEPLLAASPQGGANSFSISPWSLGGGEGGGEGAGPQ